MKTRTNIITIIVFMCLAVFVFQGCDTLKEKMPGTSKEKEEPEDKEAAGEVEEADGTTPAAEEESWVKITNFEDGATGIDTKLPLKWEIAPEVGNVKMMGVNIFECSPDGKETGGAVVVLKTLDDPDLVKAREWTFFEKDIDKYWLFTGSHKDMQELKPNAKYLMTFMIMGENKTQTIRIYFTTK
ncbi:MAG: hypothetical protein ABIH04_05010 [Planctomycetota bacterium]